MNEFFVQYQGTPKSINFKHVFFDLDEVKLSWVASSKSKTLLFAYCSVGTWESWRKDKSKFPSASIGSNVSGWPGEKWLKPNSALLGIYKARLDRIKSSGAFGVDFDNVEICEREPGIKSTVIEIIRYAKAIGLKVSLRSYHSKQSCYCYLAEQVKSQGSYSRYTPKSLLFNIEYSKVSADSRFKTAIANLALDGKKWQLI